MIKNNIITKGVVNLIRIPDIYFLPEWANSYEEREQGKTMLFEFRHELGHIYYQFIKKAIPQSITEETYYDTITPYGFNGPIVLKCQTDKKEELVRLFNEAFSEYCLENNIVAEYIRFSPWLKNHLDFQSIYTLKHNGSTFYTDLTKEDFFVNEYDANRRNKIRKTLKAGVRIEYDYTGETIPEFNRIYQMTAERNGMEDRYIFDNDFLKKTFRALSENHFIVNAIYEGICISSTINIHYGNYVHGHLAANDPKYFSLGGSSLIYYATAQWGVEHGKTHLHYGGATTQGLISFKKSFTRNGELDFYIGKKVRIKELYDALVTKKMKDGLISDPSFFPLYRG